jgi:hypothetical protein
MSLLWARMRNVLNVNIFHQAKMVLKKAGSGKFKVNDFRPWRRGILVIPSAYRTEDPGFESQQGVRFLGIYTLQCCNHNLICIVIVCT